LRLPSLLDVKNENAVSPDAVDQLNVTVKVPSACATGKKIMRALQGDVAHRTEYRPCSTNTTWEVFNPYPART
jgi:hypothetical protein